MADKAFRVRHGLVVANNVLVTNGTSVGVNTAAPSVSLEISANDAIKLPVGNTGQRPSSANGLIRYNSETSSFEGYANGAWGAIAGVHNMSTLSVATVESSNTTTNLVLKTANTSGPVITIKSNANEVSLGNTTVQVGNATVNTTVTSNSLRVGNSSVGFSVFANGNIGVGGNTTPTVDLYVNGSAAGAIGVLSYGANVAVNLADYNNYTLTLTGGANINNPTGLVPGQSGVIFLVQDGTGGRVATWGSYWKFTSNAAPTLSTAASSVDAVS